MTKRRLSKKQQAASRQERLKEEAACRKLEAAIGKATRKPKEARGESLIPSLTYSDPSNAKNFPSLLTKPPKRSRKSNAVVYDDPELQARELAAQEEIKQKKQRTAPAYNKGPYMYVTEGTDPSSLGRKN